MRKRLWITVFLLTVAFIWMQSMLPKATSSKESDSLLLFLSPLFDRLFGVGKITSKTIRKMAHFIEFAISGCAWGRVKALDGAFAAPSQLWRGTLLIWMIAFMDETIQLFSGRGAMIADVWLDTAGGFTGLLLVWLICRLWHSHQTAQANKRR